MSARQANLAQIQRWMQSVIRHPGGVSEALDSPQSREHLDVGPAELESVVRRSQAMTSAERLEIYVNAYHERLLECLREEFPATRHALGPELFEALAFGYLQKHPSQSYTLGQLGTQFPSYLAESRLHAQAAPADAPPTWPGFVIELATLERSLRDVFDGPGTEKCVPLDPRQLAELAAGGDVRLVAAPCLRLQQFDHPVDAYWAVAKDGGEPRSRNRGAPIWRFIGAITACCAARFRRRSITFCRG